MHNFDKFILYIVGAVFLIFGLGIILEMLSIPFSSLTVLLIGILSCYLYFKLNKNSLKYIACIFIPTGLAYFLISAFRITGVSNFLLLYSSLACVFLCIYMFSKRKFFIYLFLLILMYMLHAVTVSIEDMKENLLGYDCFYLGVLSTILFTFEHKSLRYIPILIALFAYICGVLSFLSAFKIITPTLFKASISLLFCIVGGLIIFYNHIKSKNYNKENNCG